MPAGFEWLVLHRLLMTGEATAHGDRLNPGRRGLINFRTPVIVPPVRRPTR